MRNDPVVALAALMLCLAGCGGTSAPGQDGGGGGTDGGTGATGGACAVLQNGWDLCEDATQSDCAATESSTAPVFHSGTACDLIGYDRTCTNPYRVKVDDICPGLPDPCTQQFTGKPCSACTQGSCGFCASSGQCMTGNASGPLHASCVAWIKTATSCPGADACRSRYGGCATCTGASGCGYCATDYTCRSGTASGPSTGTCATWKYSSCASGGMTCSECLSMCSGLPSCCTGSGCMCEAECS